MRKLYNQELAKKKLKKLMKHLHRKLIKKSWLIQMILN